MGHVNPEILKLYTHILDEASQAAMQRLAGLNTQTAQEGKEVSDDCKDGNSAQIQHNEEGRENDDGAK